MYHHVRLCITSCQFTCDLEDSQLFMTQKGTLDVLGELDKVILQHIEINALFIGK